MNISENPVAIKELLFEAVRRGASDLHITVGIPPVIRVHGSLIRTEYNRLTPADTERMLKSVLTPEQQERFAEEGELDISFAVYGLARFRVNAFRQRQSVAMVFRVVTESVPTLDSLGHPEMLKVLSRKPRGLVLVTGPTGSGKTTTLAAMIDLINHERDCHIITLEDPVEFLHRHQISIINQREINSDSKSFAHALRAALREDPDVILVGEMRDTETIATAVTAAETGHLVFATLHTGDAAQTIDRIIDVFPSYQQQQIRIQLSLTLQGIIAQQLIPTTDGTGRVCAMEIMSVTPAIRNLIREGKTHQMLSLIQTGSKFGMQSMDQSLRDLYRAGLITYEEALSRASDQETFVNLVKG